MSQSNLHFSQLYFLQFSGFVFPDFNVHNRHPNTEKDVLSPCYTVHLGVFCCVCLFSLTRYKIITFQFSWQGVNRIWAHFMQRAQEISADGTRFSRGFYEICTLGYLSRVHGSGLSQLSTSSACFRASCWSSLSCPRQAFHISAALCICRMIARTLFRAASSSLRTSLTNSSPKI